MIYVLYSKGEVVGYSDSSDGFDFRKKKGVVNGIKCDKVESRWDWADGPFELVEAIAEVLSLLSGKKFLATDAGESVSPRYDVIEAPAVGDKVSYGFNGDYYPDGEIVKISPKWMITTSTGSTYRRRGNRGQWLKPGGTWGMVAGHRDERNPHF